MQNVVLLGSPTHFARAERRYYATPFLLRSNAEFVMRAIIAAIGAALPLPRAVFKRTLSR